MVSELKIKGRQVNTAELFFEKVTFSELCKRESLGFISSVFPHIGDFFGLKKKKVISVFNNKTFMRSYDRI